MSGETLTLLVTGGLDEVRAEALRRAAPGVRIVPCSDTGELEAHIAEADAVAGHVGPEVFARAERLRWVHSWAAGPNRQLFPAFVRSDVVLTSSKGNGAIPLAEHAMMLMLMLNRDAMRWMDGQQSSEWTPFLHGELAGLSAGIFGSGRAGKDLAAKCRAFHMRVLGLRRRPGPADGFDRMYRRDELHAFLSASDFVVVTAPLTPETRGMLGEAEFRVMKPSAFYICVSRGGVAQDDVLCRAVEEGWIAGAGLDAHQTEPLPVDSPFWTLRNTIVTPHNGATTAATKARGFDIFADNLARFAAGEALTNVVDKAQGY